MFWRLLFMVAWQAAGGLAGWYLGYLDGGSKWVHASLGALLAGFAWIVLDIQKAGRLQTWLRRADAAAPVQLQGMWGDLQDRMRKLLRERERATRESDGRLQDFLAALQVSPNGVVLLDADARIEWFNQTAAAHFSFEDGRDLLQHIANLVRDPVFAGYLAAQDFQRGIVMPGKASTATRPVTLAVQLHPYGEGRSLLLSRDITAVEQADAMRRDFVANVSHEIRTPLTVVSGFVETLQSLPLDEAQRQRYLDMIAVQAQRMQTLVNDLLTLSKLEGSPPVAQGEWISAPRMLAQVALEARALSASLAQGKTPQHRVELTPPEGTASVDLAGSSAELQSAFVNLVGNAVRYTPVDGLIQISLAVMPDGRAEFAVQDSGPGIDAVHVPRLTERFYRVDHSRSRDTGGTGLGLAIVKHVAQRHSAELKIDTAPGKGSRFSLVFPASRVRILALENS